MKCRTAGSRYILLPQHSNLAAVATASLAYHNALFLGQLATIIIIVLRRLELIVNGCFLRYRQ